MDAASLAVLQKKNQGLSHSIFCLPLRNSASVCPYSVIKLRS